MIDIRKYMNISRDALFWPGDTLREMAFMEGKKTEDLMHVSKTYESFFKSLIEQHDSADYDPSTTVITITTWTQYNNVSLSLLKSIKVLYRILSRDVHLLAEIEEDFLDEDNKYINNPLFDILCYDTCLTLFIHAVKEYICIKNDFQTINADKDGRVWISLSDYSYTLCRDKVMKYLIPRLYPLSLKHDWDDICFIITLMSGPGDFFDGKISYFGFRRIHTMFKDKSREYIKDVIDLFRMERGEYIVPYIGILCPSILLQKEERMCIGDGYFVGLDPYTTDHLRIYYATKESEGVSVHEYISRGKTSTSFKNSTFYSLWQMGKYTLTFYNSLLEKYK